MNKSPNFTLLFQPSKGKKILVSKRVLGSLITLFNPNSLSNWIKKNELYLMSALFLRKPTVINDLA